MWYTPILSKALCWFSWKINQTIFLSHFRNEKSNAVKRGQVSLWRIYEVIKETDLFTLLRSRRCDKQDVCFDISVITNYDGPVNYESFFGQMCPDFPLFSTVFLRKDFFILKRIVHVTIYYCSLLSSPPRYDGTTFFLQLREGKFLMWSSDWMMKTCMLLAG